MHVSALLAVLGLSRAMRAPVARRVDAVVVGGGPGGLAAAISLRRRGLSVVVLERGEERALDVAKAYVYLIDVRGQRWTDAVGLTEVVRAQGVSNGDYELTKIHGDARGAVTTVPVLQMGSAEVAKAVWIPRAAFVRELTHKARDAGCEVRFGAAVDGLLEDEDGSVVVQCGTSNESYAPGILVGADGLQSTVRAALRARCGEAFEPLRLDKSPSAGLLYKMLCLPPDFEARNMSSAAAASAAVFRTSPTTAYTVPSVVERDEIRLGLLPSRDRSAPRTANIIKPADHRVWGLRTKEAVQDFCRESFPQLDAGGGLVVPSEAAAADFASATPGVFPKPTFLHRVAAKLGRTQVFLLGDAIHAFPPDLGQGVNSALEDVVTLDACLFDDDDDDDDGAQKDDATASYQRLRAPAAEALCRIVQVGFPYQYGQAKWSRHAFLLRFALRLALSKLSLGLLAQPVAFSVLAGEDYQQVWNKAQRTTRAYKGFAGLAAAIALANLAKHALPFAPFLGAPPVVLL